MRLSVELVEQAVGGSCRILADQAFEEGHESRTVHLLPESPGRRLFQVMRLVDDQMVVLRKQAAADLDVGEEKRVVDDHQVGCLRFGACAIDGTRYARLLPVPVPASTTSVPPRAWICATASSICSCGSRCS